LEERLNEVVREREEMQRRIADLDPIEAAINALIRREDETFVAAPLAPFAASAPFAPLAPVDDNFGGFGAKEVRSAVKQSQWGELLKPGASSR
jgi:hypothetical protein